MLKKISSRDWLVKPGKSVDLGKRPTRIEPLYADDENYESLLEEIREEMAEQQDLIYSDGRYGVLIIVQGMDTSGKDGAIKHVLRDLNPQGLQTSAFAAPTQEELRHDFLWRAHIKMPQRGKIGVFNRSYYEEVVAVRVNPDHLEKQKLPKEHRGERIWKDRFSDIVSHEQYLYRQGFRILKFFFHLSKSEQRKRLLERIDDPKKNWKFDTADMSARAEWGKYQKAYEDCLASTSTKEAPWHILPADDKKTARLLFAQLIVERMKEIPARFPKISPERERELAKIRKTLVR